MESNNGVPGGGVGAGDLGKDEVCVEGLGRGEKS